MTTYPQSFPTRSFQSLAVSAVFLGLFFWLTHRLFNDHPHLSLSALTMFELSRIAQENDPKLVGLYVLSPLAVIIWGWYGWDVFRFLWGPRGDIVLGDDGFSVLGSHHRFVDVRSLNHDHLENRLIVTLQSGVQVTIRAPLYAGFDEFFEELVSHTLPRLTAKAHEALQAGKELSFGKKFRLSSTALVVANKVIPLEAIKKARVFTGNDNGGEYEELVVERVDGKKTDANCSATDNLLLLLALLDGMCPNMKVGL